MANHKNKNGQKSGQDLTVKINNLETRFNMEMDKFKSKLSESTSSDDARETTKELSSRLQQFEKEVGKESRESKFEIISLTTKVNRY